MEARALRGYVSERTSPWWRRGELNPCPRRCPRSHLHVYPVLRFKEPNAAPAHCRPPSIHEFPATLLTRSLRRRISLLSVWRVRGIQLQTSRSIKPREPDLGNLRLFVLVRILTRPTNHPRHAVCVSNNESKPVRPRLLGGETITQSPPDCN